MDVLAWAAVSVCTFFGVILATGSGTGGGALYMPAYLLIFKDAHQAVPFAKVTIFGMSLASFLLNARRRHPKSNTPLINYEISALMEPATLGGAVVGVLLNLCMPSGLLMLMLMLVLTVTTAKTFKTACAQYRQENLSSPETESLLSEQQDDSDAPTHSKDDKRRLAQDSTALLELGHPPKASDDVSPRTPHNTKPQYNTSLELVEQGWNKSGTGGITGNGTDYSPSSGMYDRVPHVVATMGDGYELRVPVSPTKPVHDIGGGLHLAPQLFPGGAVVFLTGVWALNFILLTTAGGPHALLCGNVKQKFVAICHFVMLILATAAYGVHLHARMSQRKRNEIVEPPIEQGGLSWAKPKGLVLYPMFSFIAGVCAGSVGIGGGLVKGPLLISIGLNPLSAVSTALYMILFTSTTTTLSFGLSGRLEVAPSVWFFCLAALGAVIANYIVAALTAKSKRNSSVTFVLASVILLSMISVMASVLWEHRGGVPVRPQLSIHDACKLMHNRHSHHRFAFNHILDDD